MGTRCRIVLYAPTEAEAAAAASGAFDRVSELEAVLTDYDPGSEAGVLMRRTPGRWHRVSTDLASALRRSRLVFEASGGAFDPCIGPLTRLWRVAREEGTLPPAAVIAHARAKSGFDLVEVDPGVDRVRFDRAGMGLDFGGIGKGMAADEALAVLREHGVRAALIDFGGGLVLGDPPPGQPEGWLVEVQGGVGDRRTVRLANVGVATSGDVEQFVVIGGVRYGHIIDPREGLGLTRRTAATVVAESGWLSDALATAACVLGPEGVVGLRARFPEALIEVELGAGDAAGAGTNRGRSVRLDEHDAVAGEDRVVVEGEDAGAARR